jgi:hypothetical protein
MGDERFLRDAKRVNGERSFGFQSQLMSFEREPAAMPVGRGDSDVCVSNGN